jgi:hypothetical protein
MRRHSERGKRELDLADASLYWLAAETGVTEILTVDVADFSRYRQNGPHRVLRGQDVFRIRKPPHPSMVGIV